MLKFRVYDGGGPAKRCALVQAYLVGPDGNPVRANIAFENGLIVCEKRDAGSAALALQQLVEGCGRLVVQTCLLQDRPEPYLLSLELARHRVQLLYVKLEDWAMFDVGLPAALAKRLELARRLFIKALGYRGDDPARCDKTAKRCLAVAIDASEALALAHADLLLSRRLAGVAPKHPIGCGMSIDQPVERLGTGLLANIDFFYLPITWRDLAPEEGEYRWALMDRWCAWLSQSRFPVIAGPVVSLQPGHVPDWVYLWESDYETVRDFIYEHTHQVATRYKNVVTAWNVASGLHVNTHFHFNFEQIMELSRMTTMLVKKTQPAARVLVEVCQPFGEYYASNHRSIPPQLYANLLVQNAIPFDGFIIKLLMGQDEPGQRARDLTQISHLLDQYAHLGKPCTVAIAAPSGPAPKQTGKHADRRDAGKDNEAGGYWRKPWSQLVQSRWLETVCRVALSKPFVESVAWYQWADGPDAELPMSGLIDAKKQPKAALRKLASLNSGKLWPREGKGTAEPPAPEGR